MLNQLELFAGIGGFTVAGEQVEGFKTTQFVEIDKDAQAVLKSNFPNIPIHSDIKTYQCCRGDFDIITGGFPCTGTSVAGSRTGFDHKESALWFEQLRIINECQPKFVVIENPEGLINTGLRAVLGGLRMVGYSWDDPQLISAKWFNAPHQRNRIFICAYPERILKGKQPSRWSDQMRGMVQEQRAFTKFPMFESSDHGAVARFPKGLDEVPMGVERGSRGRIRSRYLFGRTVIPAQAAIALRRVKYLNEFT